MKLSKQLSVWGVLLGLFFLLIWVLHSAITPFLAALALAYFLNPVIERLSKNGTTRLWSTCIIVFGVLLFCVFALALIVPVLFDQAQQVVKTAPEIFSKLSIWLDQTAHRLIPSFFPNNEGALDQTLTRLGQNAESWGVRVLQQLWSGGMAAVNIVTFLVITPVVAFYLLLDWHKIIETLDNLLPKDHAPLIRRLAADIDDVLAGFLRGQLTVCFILGAFYAVALTLIGLNYSLLVGAVAGIFTFIPFVGSLVGFALSMAVALSQFWGEWASILSVAFVFIVGQALEGNFLTPRLMGEHVGLHPVWLLFAMSAFGTLFGFVGLLIAVPAAAAIGVCMRYGVLHYLGSPLYYGKRGQTELKADICDEISHDETKIEQDG